MLRRFALLAFALIAGAASPVFADEVGCVSTVFKLVGPNDKICIDSFRDPKVDGVVCHVSRAKTGGVKGAVGLDEDTSDASIACRQIGPITIKGDLKDGEKHIRRLFGELGSHHAIHSGYPFVLR